MTSILTEAEDLVNGDRAQAYGKPSDNFRRWANLCRATERPALALLTPEDIAIIMALGKLARETNSVKRDNPVDACGYLEIYSQITEGR